MRRDYATGKAEHICMEACTCSARLRRRPSTTRTPLVEVVRGREPRAAEDDLDHVGDGNDPGLVLLRELAFKVGRVRAAMAAWRS